MTHTQNRLKKFSRDPDYQVKLGNRQITDRSLEIIAVIERYRLIPTSLILRLVQGDERTTSHHLQALYHRGLVNRFCFFGPTGRPQEFNYFLDNPSALNLLIERDEVDPDSLDFKAVRYNREKWTPIINARSREYSAGREGEFLYPKEVSEGQFLYARHELMISRFHAMLELGSRASRGKVNLAAWYQGPILFNSVEAPRMTYRNGEWHRGKTTEKIPHRPDALFSLKIQGREEPLHYFYEADRKTTNTRRMIKKLRGHFHYAVVNRQQRKDYKINRIRAVLIETLDTAWAEALRKAAQHPVVSGNNPSELFWFTASTFFTRLVEKEEGHKIKRIKRMPFFIDHPESVFDRVWFAPADEPGDQPRSLLD